MPKISTPDGVELYFEEVGRGTPIIFVHEYAGDYRSWEPQLRHFARAHRCVTFSQRGYPPSDVPPRAEQYSQDTARDDVRALMDALGVDRAHVVGHSMGAYTTLHVGLTYPERCISLAALGCGWGSSADPRQCEAMRALAAETGKMFADEPMAQAAAKYADAPMRQAQKNKDPRGWAEFARLLAEHSSVGHAHTMMSLQLKRPTLWDLQADLKRLHVPLLVIVGDEDEPCLDGSVFLKRTVPSAALQIIPRAGHTINSEEPGAVNDALAELFAAAESGRWLAHKPASVSAPR